jgi:hypothetical protein
MRAFGAIGAAAGLALAAAVFPGVSLSVSRETAPPGGIAQMKVFVTEPKPISTGGAFMTFDAYADVVGIALMNPNQDVAGVALVRGTDVSLAFTSPSATFGTSVDYPVLAVAGHVPADAPIGAYYPLTIDATAVQLLRNQRRRASILSCGTPCRCCRRRPSRRRRSPCRQLRRRPPTGSPSRTSSRSTRSRHSISSTPLA